MKKQLLSLGAFASLAMLLATLAVNKHYVSLEAASLAVLGAFSLIAGLSTWQKSKREMGERAQGSGKTGSALIWLLIAFAASAVFALVQALQEGWDIGDTIGSIFFMVFAGLSIYEILRQRQEKIRSSRLPN